MINTSELEYIEIGRNLKLLSGFPFSSKYFSNESGFPLIRIRDILTSKVETYYSGPYIETYVVKQGDILIGMDGDFHVVKWRNDEGLLNQRVLKIEVSDSDIISLRFIFYWLGPYIQHVNNITAATTVKHLSVKDLYKARGFIPQIAKQKKIAAILETIDQVIEKTEALIHKYRQIKAGLMHDLFTRGLTPDGKLRPPREKAPELYQKTPIGWIPKEWVFTTCSNVCEKIIDCKNRTPPITSEGFPVIRTPNVRNGAFVDKELVFTDYDSYLIWSARGKPKVGDVVITREAPVGEVCMIPDRHPEACLGQRMMLYRPDAGIIDSNFFLYVLQSRAIRNRLDLISGGSTVGHVRVGDIRDLWIFHPECRIEQENIGETLSNISRKIESEDAYRRKLHKQKSGLMHDLLTGKVPVNTDPAETTDASAE